VAVNHYSKLVAWQLADELDTCVIQLVQVTTARRDFEFRDQLLACSSGVSANIAEGFTRKSPRDECRFYDFALSSLSETEIWLQAGLKRKHFSQTEIAPLLRLAFRVRSATVAFKRHQWKYFESNNGQKLHRQPNSQSGPTERSGRSRRKLDNP
jgi:four helix bundle protein